MGGRLRLAPTLSLPLSAVTQTFGVFGQRGTGKSTTAAVLVEQMVGAGGRCVVGDPTGVWWGLTHEGSGPGLPGIIFGGEHADVPLERTAGHVIAEFVVGQDEYPLVVLDLKLLRKGARAQFMADFLESLYHLNREALHVVLDEAHTLAPQQAREGGDLIRCLGAVEDVVALGRARGLGATLIAQRFATLNANVREQVATLLVHQLTGSLDIAALKKWIAANGDPSQEKLVLAEVAKREVGEALVWSPAFLKFLGVVQVDRATTFDSRATPEVGERVQEPGERAQVDLAVLRERMAATIEEVESNDPKALRARVAELERQLAEATPTVVEIPVYGEGQAETLEALLPRVRAGQDALAATYLELRDVLAPIEYNVKHAGRNIVPAPEARPADPPDEEPRRSGKPETNGSAPGAAAESGASGGAVLPSAARNLLDTLARHSPMQVTPSQLGLLSHRKARGGSWNTAMRTLRDSGLIREQGGLVALTEAGIDATGVDASRALSRGELLERWRAVLPTAPLAILDKVIEHEGPVSPELVAQQLGKQARGGSWNTALRVLIQNGLVVKSPVGLVAVFHDQKLST